MLLNGFDIDTATGGRNVELRVGDFPSLGINVDLLVVSAFEGAYAPTPGTMLGCLSEVYGLRLHQLPVALDLRSSPLRSWVSGPIPWEDLSASRKASAAYSHFQRIAVVEGTLQWHPDDLLPWPPFNRLFSLLALLPLRKIPFSSVASPLLGSGRQGIDPLLHFPELLNAYREGFRHVSELQRLILFGKTDQALRPLGEAIDAALNRPDSQSTRLQLPSELPGLDSLQRLLRDTNRAEAAEHSSLRQDLQELLSLLRSQEISPIALGIHCRRVVEQLVQQSLLSHAAQRVNLFSGIHQLRDRNVDPWVISCLHQVRAFGNWMSHPQGMGRHRPVELSDVLAMLSALQRVLADYPWIRP